MYKMYNIKYTELNRVQSVRTMYNQRIYTVYRTSYLIGQMLGHSIYELSSVHFILRILHMIAQYIRKYCNLL
jgi:hypothetical protein